jgi:serine/threonine-protein kinase HipA
MPVYWLRIVHQNSKEMKKHSDAPILVYADWQGIDGPLLMGELVAQPIRGREVFSFSYDVEWLLHPACRVLDPELQLYSGRQYTSEQRPNFGVFLDSSPDRWGRMLMKRREAFLARSENRPEQVLFESDYLLGVFDRLRMGGLRFRTATGGEFLSHADEFAAPPWASLRELEHACSLIESLRSPPR